MTQPPSIPLPTPQGQIYTVDRHGAAIYRVGYAPDPWEWTPWEYATDGRFAGRWDDPDGVWRTLYCGISALACYLEWAVAEYIDWFNHRCLHGEIGHVPPAEYEATYWSN